MLSFGEIIFGGILIIGLLGRKQFSHFFKGGNKALKTFVNEVSKPNKNIKSGKRRKKVKKIENEESSKNKNNSQE
eukprot:TRINITY_DN112532_c1_g1_i2.p1 TRINITY_DN112532_c1_g1~~TRINITY_DN112532_c1_g1_i2.p1  ORF type:complete len:75 (+),score=9.21 TRINITY_DN112532_c1_g1_i2:28-252(+)